MAEHRGGSGNLLKTVKKLLKQVVKVVQHSGGNFKNDPQRASEAGKKADRIATAWPQVR